MSWFVILLSIFGGILLLAGLTMLVIEVLPTFISGIALIKYKAAVYVENEKEYIRLKSEAKKALKMEKAGIKQDPEALTPIDEIIEQVNK